MYACAKMKRVTDPLDDKVKARIVGRGTVEKDYVSSGSEHGGEVDGVVSSSLPELFFDFSVRDGGDSLLETGESDSECESSIHESCLRNVDIIRPILFDRTDEFENAVTDQVLKAVEVYTCLKSDKQLLRRNVMAFLRDRGCNAAICKTSWERSGGITAGSYEFIDVVANDSAARYFVDLDFASEFEIARPTNSYEHLLQHLPTVFVGRNDDLKLILRAMSDAARRSLKSRGLYVPPWRKLRFMQNKWFGPYRRTTNLYPAKFSLTASTNQTYAVKCSAVGFDNAVNAGRLACASTARTSDCSYG